GVICDIADAAMGMAFATTLEEGQSFTTIELKVNFLRPVIKSHLVATGKVVTRGRTIGLVECEVVDERGKLVAKAASTCMVLKNHL
ncbi:PaaI family thioesterase, partial [Candidatus Acetothermia bacterium]|nr:PaaI family thioesterase [Candidatus Acetothermia bacterium]